VLLNHIDISVHQISSYTADGKEATREIEVSSLLIPGKAGKREIPLYIGEYYLMTAENVVEDTPRGKVVKKNVRVLHTTPTNGFPCTTRIGAGGKLDAVEKLELIEKPYRGICALLEKVGYDTTPKQPSKPDAVPKRKKV
jgi:hypothetical protein